jgi:bacillaene synthase trans-acting acyltransferase
MSSTGATSISWTSAPSGTLATFVKYLLPADSASTFSDVINPFGMNERTYRGALQRIGLNDAAGTAYGLGNASYSARRASS